MPAAYPGAIAASRRAGSSPSTRIVDVRGYPVDGLSGLVGPARLKSTLPGPGIQVGKGRADLPHQEERAAPLCLLSCWFERGLCFLYSAQDQ